MAPAVTMAPIGNSLTHSLTYLFIYLRTHALTLRFKYINRM
jgi:hypothetical protein